MIESNQSDEQQCQTENDTSTSYDQEDLEDSYRHNTGREAVQFIHEENEFDLSDFDDDFDDDFALISDDDLEQEHQNPL